MQKSWLQGAERPTGLWLALGCQTLTGKTARQHIGDAQLTASVKSALVAQREGRLMWIDADAEHGIIYLTGMVPSEEDREKAERVANEITGVSQVRNGLQVEQRTT